MERGQRAVVAFGLSKSCYVVLKLLESSKEELTQKNLIEETALSPRTIKYALKRLEKSNAILSEIDSSDLRRKRYFFSCKIKLEDGK